MSFNNPLIRVVAAMVVHRKRGKNRCEYADNFQSTVPSVDCIVGPSPKRGAVGIIRRL